MKSGRINIKNSLYIISLIASVLYLVFFCMNVSELAARHMDDEVFYPVIAIAFSAILCMAMIAVYKIRPFDKKLFFIPSLFLICSFLSLAIGINTVCVLCDH